MGERLAVFVPTPDVALAVAPIALVYGFIVFAFVGTLKEKRGVRTAYTRKTLHFLTFTMAGFIQLWFGVAGVVVYGLTLSVLVAYALFRGTGHSWYEALARPSDAPHRTLFIIVPLLTTAFGGVFSNLLFARFAYIGYLVCGWGDAVGEPVGTRWGRHRYNVPSLGGVKAQRSLEGSAAVFLVGAIAAAGGLLAGGYPPASALPVGVAAGAAGALVEAFSNHGLDNLTTQVAASAVSSWLS